MISDVLIKTRVIASKEDFELYKSNINLLLASNSKNMAYTCVDSYDYEGVFFSSLEWNSVEPKYPFIVTSLIVKHVRADITFSIRSQDGDGLDPISSKSDSTISAGPMTTPIVYTIRHSIALLKSRVKDIQEPTVAVSSAPIGDDTGFRDI